MRKIFPALIMTALVSGCGNSTSEVEYIAPKISDNTEIQKAYEKCISETREEVRADNPGTPDDIMNFMYDVANQTCNSVVAVTCNKNINSSSCKIVLEMYRD